MQQGGRLGFVRCPASVCIQALLSVMDPDARECRTSFRLAYFPSTVLLSSSVRLRTSGSKNCSNARLFYSQQQKYCSKSVHAEAMMTTLWCSTRVEN